MTLEINFEDFEILEGGGFGKAHYVIKSLSREFKNGVVIVVNLVNRASLLQLHQKYFLFWSEGEVPDQVIKSIVHQDFLKKYDDVKIEKIKDKGNLIICVREQVPTKLFSIFSDGPSDEEIIRNLGVALEREIDDSKAHVGVPS